MRILSILTMLLITITANSQKKQVSVFEFDKKNSIAYIEDGVYKLIQEVKPSTEITMYSKYYNNYKNISDENVKYSLKKVIRVRNIKNWSTFMNENFILEYWENIAGQVKIIMSKMANTAKLKEV